MAIYMKLDGINGNVTAKGYEKWIELESIDFSVSRHIDTKPGKVTDRESTRPSVSEFSITKLMDSATPALFTEACVGKSKKTVLIHCCQTGDNINPYMEYTFNNVIISNYHVNLEIPAEGKKAYPHETVSLNFDKIEMKFIPYDEAHKAQSPIPAGYDLSTAQKI